MSRVDHLTEAGVFILLGDDLAFLDLLESLAS